MDVRVILDSLNWKLGGILKRWSLSNKRGWRCPWMSPGGVVLVSSFFFGLCLWWMFLFGGRWVVDIFDVYSYDYCIFVYLLCMSCILLSWNIHICLKGRFNSNGTGSGNRSGLSDYTSEGTGQICLATFWAMCAQNSLFSASIFPQLDEETFWYSHNGLLSAFGWKVRKTWRSWRHDLSEFFKSQYGTWGNGTNNQGLSYTPTS